MNEPVDLNHAPPPPPPSPPEPPPTPGNPWEQRDRLGFGGGLLSAIKLFVTNPGEAYAQTLKRGDFVSPLLFAVIVGWFGSLVGQVWQYLFQGMTMGMFPAEFRDQMPLYVGSPIFLAINLVLTPFYLVFALFLWSAIHHLSLMLVGALNESDAGYEGTFRVNGYGYVAQLGAVVPILGWLITIVWWVVLMVIGAVRIHGTTPGRALAAALIPIVFCCVCVGLALALGAAALWSAFQSMG